MTTSSTSADERRERNLKTIQQFFQFLQEKDIARWNSLWDEHGRIWVPYPVAGLPTIIEGKAQIAPAFEQLFAAYLSFVPHISEIYPAVDPDVVIVEWTSEATLRANGQVYRGVPITVFKFCDGLIVEYHDYFNPLTFQVVVDALGASS